MSSPPWCDVIVTSCCHCNNKQEAATELSPFMSGLGQGFCNRLWCDGKQILDAGSWILDETLAQIRNPESVWMDHLYINPLVTIKEIRSVTGVSDATAGRLVKKMIELGVLSEITGYAPNRKFLYEDYFLAIDSSLIVFREKVHLT